MKSTYVIVFHKEYVEFFILNLNSIEPLYEYQISNYKNQKKCHTLNIKQFKKAQRIDHMVKEISFTNKVYVNAHSLISFANKWQWPIKWVTTHQQLLFFFFLGLGVVNLGSDFDNSLRLIKEK